MDTPEIRKQLREMSDVLGTVRMSLETIRDEYQEYFDAQSEEWQKSDIGEEIEDDIDTLASHIDSLDDIETDLFEFAKSTKGKEGKPASAEEEE